MKNKKLENIICLMIIIVGLLSFLSIMLFVLIKKDLVIDQKVINGVLKIRNKGLTGFVKVFTHIGSVYTVIAISLLTLLIIKNKQIGIFTTLCVFLGCVISVVVKYVIRRLRPENIALIEETGFSFPSAHALLSVVLFGALAYFVLVYVKPIWLKTIVSSTFILISILVALTRVYLGVHYFSDIFAGIILGIVIVASVVILKNFVFAKLNKNKS